MQRTIVDNRYSILDPLGSGGMGRVYLARDEVLERDVALKILKDTYADSKDFIERFRREAMNAGALSHPNIVAVYDRGEALDGSVYMAMEYVPGGTLGDRISREGPLGVAETVRIALQIAEALRAAHERGVIHRDIKPHNIFLTEAFVGSVKVGDFGIARAADATAMTETSLILGTVRYLSPEQARGEPVGPRGDLYSLGVVLYEMLTGWVPFDAENPIAIAMKHVSEDPPSPQETNPEVSDGLDLVTRWLLAKNPADRYGSADELIEDLQRVRDGLSPAVTQPQPADDRTAAREDLTIPEGLTIPLDRRNQRRRRRLGAFLVAAVAALLIAVVAPISVAASRTGGFGELYATVFPEEQALAVNGVVTPQASDPDEPVTAVAVPGVSGRNLGRDEAEKILREAGFTVSVDTQESSVAEAGRIIAQDPKGGEDALPRSEVEITLGEGPPMTEVPALADLTVLQAEAALLDAGLGVGNISEAASASVPEGSVLSQDAVAGTEVREDTEVGFTVSSGPEPVAPEPVVSEPVAPEPAPATEEAPQIQQEDPPAETAPPQPEPQPERAPVSPEPAQPEPVTRDPEPRRDPGGARLDPVGPVQLDPVNPDKPDISEPEFESD